MAALRKTRKSNGDFGIGLYANIVAAVLSVIADATAVAQTSSTFAQTGFMKLARQSETATLLPSGEVLVAGGNFFNCGRNPKDVTSTAEIFDPATGTFAYTGSMTIPRVGHTATLLQNGEVLITGGVDNNNQLRGTTEIYDPATGSFTQTGNMTEARVGHTATLLQSGKVLVAGGVFYGTSSLTNTAELYDPTTGTFALTGNLTSPLSGQVANLLPDGEVLVAGGWGYHRSSSYVNAQLYDSSTGSFTPFPQNIGSLHGIGVSSSTLAGGRVLIAGGAVDKAPDDNYGAAGDVYDPVSGSFEGPFGFATGGPSPVYTIGRGFQTTTLLGSGEVLMAGGWGWDGDQGPVGQLARAELFNRATNTFRETGPMLIHKYLHAAAELSDGRALVAGGCDGYNTRGEAELYTP